MAPNPLPFRRYIFFSSVTHLALFLFFIIVGPQMQLPEKQEPLSVVMVELPRGTNEEIGLGVEQSKTLPEAPIPKEPTPPPQPPPPAKPQMVEPKPEVKQPPVVVEKRPKPKTELSPEDKKMREALAKLDKDIKNRNKPPSMAQVKNPSEGSIYGTSDKPITSIPPEAELMRYRATVRARILREWIAPAGVRDLPPNVRPSVRISVRISPSGYITSTGFAKKSDNPSFDASAMRAVQRASPLPTPPESVKEMALTKGFTIDFVVR